MAVRRRRQPAWVPKGHNGDGRALVPRVRRLIIQTFAAPYLQGMIRSSLSMAVSSWRAAGISASKLGQSLLLVCALMPVLLHGEEQGHLALDGILKVKGGDLFGARMVMVDHMGHSVVLGSGLSHFSLSLELNSEYLLEFSKEGCVTKQVLVDTRVPTGDYVFRNYGFPFQVTLQAPRQGQAYEYDGPVARVHFVPAIDDFGYDTDYRVKPMPALAEAMIDVRVSLAASRAAVSEPVVLPPPAEAAAQDPLPAMVPAAGLVIVNEPVRTEEPAPVIEPAVVREAAAPPMEAPSDEMGIRAEEVPAETGEDVPLEEPPAFVRQPPPARAPRPKPKPAPVQPVDPIPAVTISGHVLMDSDREEAVVVEHLRVTRIVRIIEEGRVVEYRRVTHRYGSTVHFRNGVACSAARFERGVGQ